MTEDEIVDEAYGLTKQLLAIGDDADDYKSFVTALTVALTRAMLKVCVAEGIDLNVMRRNLQTAIDWNLQKLTEHEN